MRRSIVVMLSLVVYSRTEQSVRETHAAPARPVWSRARTLALCKGLHHSLPHSLRVSNYRSTGLHRNAAETGEISRLQVEKAAIAIKCGVVVGVDYAYS